MISQLPWKLLMTSIAAWIKNPFRRTSEHNHIYNYSLEIFPFFINSNILLNKLDIV